MSLTFKLIIKKTATVFLYAITITACSKKPETLPVTQPQPVVEMIYTNLNDREIKYQQNGVTLDVNNDNRADLLFDSYLIGDNLNAVDKRQYYVLSSIRTALPVNINEQVPVLHSKDIIPLNHFNGNYWNTASEVILMERNEFANGTIVWRGNWLERERKYFAFQYLNNDQRYNGWVELTADKNGERLVLHRMAISKYPEKEVKAGE